MKALLFLFTLLAVDAVAADARQPLSRASAFAAESDAWIASALARVEVVPSIAVAVVVDDEAVLTRAYGTADREAGTPADEETLYYIASSTKSYVGLLAAILDARGTLSLASSLEEHLHGVTLTDSLRPGEVTLENLLTHTSGIDNSPIAYRLAYTGDHDPETLWRILGSSIGAEGAQLGTFRYSNVGYNIYGMILDRESGTRWQEHLEREIFGPCGMTRTSATVSRGDRAGWPKAAPYFGLDPGGIRRLYLEKQDNTMQSAGGIMTTAVDVARWLELHLNDGLLDGEQIVPSEVVRRTHERLTDADQSRSPFGQSGYGLGWSHGAHRDHAVLSHGGGFAGFRSIISFMPDERIGVAVMVNEGSLGGELLRVVAHRAYDWWLDAPLGETDAALDDLVTRLPMFRERMHSELAKRAAREWTLARPLDRYTGTFVSPLYGTITITETSGQLRVSAGNLACTAEPYTKAECARVELVPGTGRVIGFEPEEGAVERIRYDGETFERTIVEG